MSLVQIENKIENEKTEVRKAFCEALMELAEKNNDIVVMDADLMGAMGLKPFKSRYPDRTFDCGIQEANMIGMACGLSIKGKVPFVHTFGPFATRRIADQIYMSGAYNKANVRIIGSDPGITAAYNGGTHMPLDDMGIMRGFPTITVIEPTDITMLKSIVRQTANQYGMFYIRLVRKSARKIYKDGTEFEIGKSVTIREGNDVTIIASGYCVAEALSAAEILHNEGIEARILDMFTWKPIDEASINAAAQETGAIVTAENHNVFNGLGSAVSEVLVKNKPCPVEMIAVQDEFGEVGPVSYLRERFHLTDYDIVAAVRRVIERKHNIR